MTPVATYRGKGLALRGVGLALLSLLFLGTAALVPFFIAHEGASWALLALALMPLALGWATLAAGVRRLRAALEKDCFLRAGPAGLALRLPGLEYSFTWDEVESLSWSLDGGDKTLVIRARGGALEVDGSYFREPVKDILENVRRAAHPRPLPIPKTTL